MLRSVESGPAADLDPRAITDEQDLVDLDETYLPSDQEDNRPAEASRSHAETSASFSALADPRAGANSVGQESDEEFDR